MIALLLLLLFQAGGTPQGSVSGTVIDAASQYREPLYRARVELATDSASLTTRTNESGHFSFANVPPGKYRLLVGNDGFIRQAMPITVVAGLPRNNLVIALDVAPTFTGHVRDSNNVPIRNILVEALKPVYGPRGTRSIVVAESALSDDRGEYHLYWLDPGDYYIRASSLSQKPGFTIPGNPSSDSAAPSYAPTYYPGTRDSGEATPIHLRVGYNASGFDFKLLPANTFSIGGIISIESSGECVGTDIVISPAGATASSQTFKGRSAPPPSRDCGKYGIGGMTDGTYILSASYSNEAQQLTVHRKITAKVAEYTVMLKLAPGSAVNGRITTNSGTIADLRSAHIVLDSIDPDLPSPQRASVDANAQFVVPRVEPGDYDLGIPDLPGDTYIQSAQSGEVDILSKPLHVEYAAPGPVRIVLGADGSRLDGVVVDGGDKAFANAQVVLVPDTNRRLSPTMFRSSMSGDDGRFTLRGIPPGDYKLFAWQRIEPNAYMNPNYLAGFEILGLPLTIQPSSVGTVSVRLIPSD
jgi:protocatechuate 3,4-dioxygenase beta subunit